MLGKLLKYDMKIQMKLLGIMYLVVGLIAGTSAIFEAVDRGMHRTSRLIHVINLITMGLAVLAVVAMVVGTFIYAVLRFRKNLFKDEGYLMNTLPVKPWQLYMSKWISASICCILSVLVAIVALSLAFLHMVNIPDMLGGISAAGLPGWYIPLTAFMLLLTIPGSLSQFYASLAFGYTMRSPMNKDLLSVLSYVVLYMIQQAFGVVIMLVWMVVNFSNGGLFDQMISGGSTYVDPFAATQAVSDYVGSIYVASIVILVVTSTVLSVLSIWRMNRYMNLN